MKIKWRFILPETWMRSPDPKSTKKVKVLAFMDLWDDPSMILITDGEHGFLSIPAEQVEKKVVRCETPELFRPAQAEGMDANFYSLTFYYIGNDPLVTKLFFDKNQEKQS